MARQSISNRYIKLEDLRTLLTKKFGVGNFKIQERDESYEINIPELLTEDLGKMEELRENLERLRFANANNEGRYFIPEVDLSGVVSESAVKLALRILGTPVYEIKDLTESILRGARRCFAILILVHRGEAISGFFRGDSLQQSHPDDRLPYNSETLQDIFGAEPSSLTIRHFLEKQWEFAIPIMYQHSIPRTLDTNAILPFLHEEPAGEGSMGTVSKIELHPGCHRLPVEGHKVIRKQLRCAEKNAAVFQKELENLSILTHLEHDNIVRLFCSYVYRGTYNLIFAVADGGSLTELLDGNRKTRAPEGSQLLLALAGLASAIDAMHNFTSAALDLNLSGCHHDLAPRNILIHGESFLLADFGLSSFRSMEEDSLTTFREVRGSYVAPECQKFRDGRVQTEKVGRASDIWSFGCILSEVLTYTALGPKGVAEFREKRKSEVTPGIEWFRFHQGSERPNPEVGLWLADLQVNGEPYQVRMVDLIRNMLSMDPNERPRSAQVLTALRGISILSIASSINLGNTRPDADYMLGKLRLKSWLHAFTQLLDEDVQDKQGKLDFDFPKIVQALKEIHRIMESREVGATNTKHQQQSLFRYQHARLIESLPPNYRSVAKEHLVEQVLQTHDTEQLGGLSTAITEAGDEDIGVLVAVKHLTALAEAGRLIEQENLILDQSDITVTADIDIHSLALHGPASEPVLVEWLRYREPWAYKRVGDELRRRLASVVGLFHSEDAARIPGSLHCKGIFHDPSSPAFGVVYGIPRSERQPVTLHKLLGAGSTHRPPLELRFRLAFDICQCIYMFHKVGWLHRNLHSMNVLFFPPKEAENVEWAREPRIFGFAGSRENRLDSFSYGPDEDFRLRQYQHPEYLMHHERYREEFDYYSIGMILLEIGLWRTLSTLTKSKSNRFQGLSDEQFRREIIARRVPELRIAMGTHFMEATCTCLEGGFVGRSRDLGTERDAWYMSFKSLVMDRIPLIG